MWEGKDLLFSAFSAKCSKKCPQLDSTNILVIDIILDPLIFFPSLGEGRIYLQQDAKTSVCLPTVGSVGGTGGTSRCTNT